MRSLFNIVGQGLIVATIALNVGCDEKPAANKPATSSPCDATKDPSCNATPSTSGSSDKLGTDLQADSAVKGAHSGLISDLCKPYKSGSSTTTTVAELRKPERIYKGGSETKITERSEEQANQRSKMELYTSNIYSTDATSYYKMMKLQMMDPDGFKAAGFESDPAIKYTIQNKTASTVSFNYINDAETTVVVNYDAKTTFYEVKSSDSGIKRYVVGTKLTKSNETVIELEGIVVINEYKGDGGTMVAEVFTMSNQLYDNNNDHTTTLKKAKTNIGNEQIRSFKNAGKSRAHFSKE